MKYSVMTFNNYNEALDYYFDNSDQFVETKEFPRGINYEIIRHPNSEKCTLIIARIEKQPGLPEKIAKARKAKLTKFINQDYNHRIRAGILLEALKTNDINIKKWCFLWTTGRISGSNSVWESMAFVAGSTTGFTVSTLAASLKDADSLGYTLGNLSKTILAKLNKIVKAVKSDMKPFENQLNNL